MSKSIVQTHAGDDSDGRIWGIEGMNILIIIAGLVLSVGVAMTLFRSQSHPPLLCFGVGLLPVGLSLAYVFGLRQGKPKAFDSDLLESLASGRAWSAPTKQPRNPLAADERA